MKNKIIQDVFDMFQSIYLVGGSIRDILMGKEPKDYDFATSLQPDEVEDIVRQHNKKAYCVGKRFGTIGFKHEGYFIEVTTFRAEKYKAGDRKPQVEFVRDIVSDLSRRDFTMNAIALSKKKLIDPFNGKDDIKNGIIRAVGNAKTRIKEDPLRMLRCARFASQLGFQIDYEMLDKMKDNAYSILNISKERWVMELDKLIMTDNPRKGLEILMNCRLFNFMIPELSLQLDYEQNNPHHQYNLWVHTLLVIQNCPKDINIRWAYLLHDIAKPFVRQEKDNRSVYYKHEYLGAEIVEKTALYLKWSNERREKVKEIVLNHLTGKYKKYDDMGK